MTPRLLPLSNMGRLKILSVRSIRELSGPRKPRLPAGLGASYIWMTSSLGAVHHTLSFSVVTVRWRALRLWLLEPLSVWLAFVGIVAVWVLMDVPAATFQEQAIYAGMVLELMGILAVALGLSQTRKKLFGRPGFLGTATGWLRRFPALFRRPKSVTLEAQVAATSLVGADLTLGWDISPEDAPLEERVAVLEQKFEQLLKGLHNLRSDVQTKEGELSRLIESETKERKEAHSQLGQLIEEFAVGELHLETTGFIWIFVGVVLATYPF